MNEFWRFSMKNISKAFLEALKFISVKFEEYNIKTKEKGWFMTYEILVYEWGRL